MEYLIVCIAALITSGLTLFSGFGLGTLLMPVFAIFFTVDVAVAMTAVVHFLNNVFKLAMLGRNADRTAVFQFGLPAIMAALLGAKLLVWFSEMDPFFTYHLMGSEFHIMPVKLVVAILMMVFATMELAPAFEKMSFDKKYLPLGGIISGFFGGLSGHQGALRSAFLVRCGLSKKAFIATGVVIACLVDISRLSVYTTHFSMTGVSDNGILLLSAVISAFIGAFIGNRLVTKVTMCTIQVIVSVMLFAIAVGLGSGMI